MRFENCYYCHKIIYFSRSDRNVVFVDDDYDDDDDDVGGSDDDDCDGGCGGDDDDGIYSFVFVIILDIVKGIRRVCI